MSDKKILITIVIPAYNEERNFHSGRLNNLFSYLEKQKFTWELLFINDGSTDNTSSLLKKLSKEHPHTKVIDIKHGGKAIAVETGVMKARGEFVLFTDFDQSTPISEVTQFLKELQNGAEVVIAHRKHIYNWPTLQRLRSRIFNFLVQIIILPGLTDTQCGFKAFRTRIAQQLFNNLMITKKNQTGRYMGAFDVELLFIAKKMKHKIKSVDVNWYCVRAGSVAFSEPIKMLHNILSMRAYDFFNRYDELLDRK